MDKVTRQADATSKFVDNTLEAIIPQTLRDFLVALCADILFIADDIVDNLSTNDDTKALSANQGSILSDAIALKIAIADIVNDLVSTDTNKPLSANQGLVLKALVDAKLGNTGEQSIKSSGSLFVTSSADLLSNWVNLLQSGLVFKKGSYYLNIDLPSSLTVSRTITFPDKDGTVAMTSDITGGLNYQGTWNASTNSPAIPSAASGNKGYYYKVNVAGTTTIDGISTWDIGDWIISNGTVWQKVDNSETVTTVFGRVGDVTATDADYTAAQVVVTPDGVSGSPLEAVTRVSTALTGLRDAVLARLKTPTDIDCSANPNYPAGKTGDNYYVTVAGKIGGASGDTVMVGQTFFCVADNAGGTKASVGGSWRVSPTSIASSNGATTYTAASFGGLSYRTITTTKRIAYVTIGTIGGTETVVNVMPSITYTATTVTFDLVDVPTQDVNIYYFN